MQWIITSYHYNYLFPIYILLPCWTIGNNCKDDEESYNDALVARPLEHWRVHAVISSFPLRQSHWRASRLHFAPRPCCTSRCVRSASECSTLSVRDIRGDVTFCVGGQLQGQHCQAGAVPAPPARASGVVALTTFCWPACRRSSETNARGATFSYTEKPHGRSAQALACQQHRSIHSTIDMRANSTNELTKNERKKPKTHHHGITNFPEELFTPPGSGAFRKHYKPQ